jgi:phytol kinase
MTDLFSSILVLLILGSVIGITKKFSHKLSGELSRKIIHITMGCVALSFPFVFANPYTVLIVGFCALCALGVLRLNKGLREGLGSSLLSINRKSYGEIYFTIAILLVYMFHKDISLYLIPILILTFADSVAALIGKNYGRYDLSSEKEDRKSGEGSLMFFIVAFFCALVPLQLLTQVGRAEVLLISFLIGILAAIIEAISTEGNDNLLLPILTYSFLSYNIDKPIVHLMKNFYLMIFFLVAVVIVYKISKISKLSIAYALLVAYVTLILGGIVWAIAPLFLLLTFSIFPLMNKEEKKLVLTYHVIECNTIVGMVCLWFSSLFPKFSILLFMASSLSYTCQLLINSYNRIYNFHKVSKVLAASIAFLKAIIFVLTPTFILKQIAFNGLNLGEGILFTGILVCTIPVAIWLNKNYDYKQIRKKTLFTNKIGVGLLVTIYILIGGIFFEGLL